MASHNHCLFYFEGDLDVNDLNRDYFGDVRTMTACLDCYMRVSTTEQTKGFSLDTQTKIGK